MNDQQAQKPGKPGLFSIVRSTLAAAIGIQSSRNREQDFHHGSVKAFVIAGILFTVLFVGTIIAIASLVSAP